MKSMPLNREPTLSETEEFIDSHEEKLKELVQDDVAMELLEVMIRDGVATIIEELAEGYGLEVEVSSADE